MSLGRRLLAVPSFYSFVQYLLAGKYQERYVRDFIRPREGDRILDIGCGPGDIVAYLPPTVEYVGFDMSRDYIEAAKRRFDNREGVPKCRFFHGLVNHDVLNIFNSFDIVTANSVLHHLDGTEAESLFSLASKVLLPTGRLVTLDPCFAEGQSPIARMLLTRDRGGHIRTEAAYRELALSVFRHVSSTVLNDLLRIPYTNIVMECTQ